MNSSAVSTDKSTPVDSQLIANAMSAPMPKMAMTGL